MTQTQEWEYDAVRVGVAGRRGGSPTPDRDAVIHGRTRQGWSLMTVVAHPASQGGGTWAYFRRPGRAAAPAPSGPVSAPRSVPAPDLAGPRLGGGGVGLAVATS